MKKHISLLILILLTYAPGVSRAGNESDYLSQIALRDRKVVKNNRDVELSMLFDLSSLRLRTQHTLALTPVLVSKDGNREWAFPPLVVDGRIRNKVYLRAQRLESVALPPYHDATAQVVIRRRNGKEPELRLQRKGSLRAMDARRQDRIARGSTWLCEL